MKILTKKPLTLPREFMEGSVEETILELTSLGNRWYIQMRMVRSNSKGKSHRVMKCVILLRQLIKILNRLLHVSVSVFSSAKWDYVPETVGTVCTCTSQMAIIRVKGYYVRNWRASWRYKMGTLKGQWNCDRERGLRHIRW